MDTRLTDSFDRDASIGTGMHLEVGRYESFTSVTRVQIPSGTQALFPHQAACVCRFCARSRGETPKSAQSRDGAEAARLAHNQEAAGSSPAPATKPSAGGANERTPRTSDGILATSFPGTGFPADSLLQTSALDGLALLLACGCMVCALGAAAVANAIGDVE